MNTKDRAERTKSSGLSLINLYDEDTESEEESTKSDLSARPSKIQRLAVPAEVSAMYADNGEQEIVKQNVEDHQGRVRTFAHVRGNWSSYVYIPFTEHEDDSVVPVLVDLIRSAMHESDIPIQLNSSFHLSLSRTIPFRHHWLSPFVSDMKHRLSNFNSFDVVFDEFEVYTNDEKTRTFLGIKVHSSPVLCDLVEISDECLKEYKLEKYYKNPSFHVSLAWLLGNQKDNLAAIISELNSKWNSLLCKDDAISAQNVSIVEFKYGDRVSTFYLRKTS